MLPIINIDNVDNLDNFSDLMDKNGFFYVKYSDDEAMVINEAINQMKNFFLQDINKKTEKNIKIINDEYYGYRPLKKIILDGTNIIKYSETYNYRPGIKDFEIQEIFKDCFQIMLKYATTLFDQILNILGITKKLDFCGTLQMIHYPEAKNNELLGIPEHSDWGFLTLLVTTEEGLEIKNGDNWIKAPIMENHFIVNIADMLQILSNDNLKSTNHRVITKREKYSLAFFFDPSINSLINGMRYGDYLKMKINILYEEEL